MKAQTKTAIAMLGGVAALAVIGFGGGGVSPAGGASTTPTHPSSAVSPIIPNAAAPGGHAGVHMATLTGCIPGANC